MMNNTLNRNLIEEIAIGGFDGMHLAHQHLFNALTPARSAIVVIETGYANLTPSKTREHYTQLPIFYFDLQDIKHLDGKSFVHLLEKQFPNLKKIVVGYDFHFGKDRKYDFNRLKELFTSGEVEIIERVSINNSSVHSHKIRNFLKNGDIKIANKYLAHNYTIQGQIIQGQGLGKKEFFATINLECKEFILPKEGVYATLTQLDNEEHFHASVSFIGHRMSTDGSFAIETHIIGKDIVAKKEAKISFISFIRANQKFHTFKLLKEAIENDIFQAKRAIKALAL